MSSGKPKGGTIISKDRVTGRVVSYYKDDFWDLREYLQKDSGSCTINFIKSPSGIRYSAQIVKEMKWIMYLFFTESTCGRQSILSITQLCGVYQPSVKHIGDYCTQRNMKMSEFFSSALDIKRFANSNSSKNRLRTFSTLLTKLIQFGQERTGFMVLNGKHIEQIRAQERSLKLTDPTEFIPQRLLSIFVDRWLDDIESFQSNWRNIQLFINTVNRRRGSGLAHYSQYESHGITHPDWELDFQELSRKYDLIEYFDSYEIDRVMKLSSHWTYIQAICKSMIHLYSGMRYDEAMSLLTNSLVSKTDSNGIGKLFFIGETTKYSGKACKAQWITSKNILPVWNLIISMAKYTAKKENIPLPCPIFLSTTYLKLSNNKRVLKSKLAKTKLGNIDSLRHLGNEVLVRKEDMKLLKGIDPHRVWGDSKIRIGKRWVLSSHQFRRTIAILAAQSGIVSIPSLKRQLQHITSEMTFYYTRGTSGYDPGLAEMDADFIDLFRRSQPEAAAYSYIVDVLLTPDIVLGGTSNSGVKPASESKTNIRLLKNRKGLVSKFEKGELAYRETVLGSCLKQGICVERAHNSLTACLKCPTSKIKLEKLDRVIEVHSDFSKTLDDKTIEGIDAKRILSDLVKYRKKADLYD